VLVDGRLDVNVALNRPAYQCRKFGPYSASRANDGNRNPGMFAGSCAHTHTCTNPWWSVDFGVALHVLGVKFTNRDSVNGSYAVSIMPIRVQKKNTHSRFLLHLREKFLD